MTKPTIAETILAAAKSDDEDLIAATISEVEDAAPAMREKAEATLKAALNPAIPAKEARKMRDTAQDDKFEADRAEAALTGLKERLAEVRHAKEQAQRLTAHDAARETLSRAAQLFAEQWDAHLAALGRIGHAMHAAELAVKRVNRELPDDAPALILPRAWSDHFGALSKMLTTDGRSVVPSDIAWLKVVAPDELNELAAQADHTDAA